MAHGRALSSPPEGGLPPAKSWVCSSGLLTLSHTLPTLHLAPVSHTSQGVGGPRSTTLGTKHSTVIRNNFICFICWLIISSTLA